MIMDYEAARRAASGERYLAANSANRLPFLEDNNSCIRTMGVESYVTAIVASFMLVAHGCSVFVV